MPDEEQMPEPRMAFRRQPPLFDHTFAVLGWAQRASSAVGSSRFFEMISRAEFYFAQAARHAKTPAEAALLIGLHTLLDELLTANAQALNVLTESVSGMNAAEATEFTELAEGDDPS